MYNKQNEIEAIIEDLIENVILETFSNNFSCTKECEHAIELLISKLEDIDIRTFKDYFDN